LGGLPCPMMPLGHLDSLPVELLRHIFVHLGAADLLCVARVGRACHTASCDDQVWRVLVARELRPMADAFFAGILPAPQEGLRWRPHFFGLRANWKRLAAERTGRLLVQIRMQPFSGRGRHEVPSLWCGPNRPATYGVYDVTEFAVEHPGIDLNEAASLEDASEWFEMAAHSDAALRRLATLAVPGLDALPYDSELDEVRRARRRRLRSCAPFILSCITRPPASALGTIALTIAVAVFVVAGAAVSLFELPEWWSDALSKALGGFVTAASACAHLWRFGRGIASLEKSVRHVPAAGTARG